MFARVYDRERNRYYKSIVYAILDIGYHSKAIVYDSAADCFALVDYFDKRANDLLPQYEIISDTDKDSRVYKEKALLLKLKKYCREQGYDAAALQCFYGYADVFENFPFLLALLRDKKVPADRAGNTTARQQRRWRVELHPLAGGRGRFYAAVRLFPRRGFGENGVRRGAL